MGHDVKYVSYSESWLKKLKMTVLGDQSKSMGDTWKAEKRMIQASAKSATCSAIRTGCRICEAQCRKKMLCTLFQKQGKIAIKGTKCNAFP